MPNYEDLKAARAHAKAVAAALKDQEARERLQREVCKAAPDPAAPIMSSSPTTMTPSSPTTQPVSIYQAVEAARNGASRMRTPRPDKWRCPACGATSHSVEERDTHACKTDKAAETVLAEAARIVDGPRRESYGTPAENHGRTAALWSAYLGVPITARQVCMLNVLQKVARDAHSPKRDNLVDIAGYARNAELCDTPTRPRQGAAGLPDLEWSFDNEEVVPE